MFSFVAVVKKLNFCCPKDTFSLPLPNNKPELMRDCSVYSISVLQRLLICMYGASLWLV